jgi:hypothetical protein
MSRSNASVKWAQRSDCLLITIDVIDAKATRVEFIGNQIKIEGSGVCKMGMDACPFTVVLMLNDDIADKGHSYKVLGQHIQVRAAKAKPGPWDKLTVESPKTLRLWLSCDWSLWKDPEDENPSEKLEFGGGGYGDVGNMVNFTEADSDGEGDERPPADLSDLGV